MQAPINLMMMMLDDHSKGAIAQAEIKKKSMTAYSCYVLRGGFYYAVLPKQWCLQHSGTRCYRK